jgi:hypothetical protein
MEFIKGDKVIVPKGTEVYSWRLSSPIVLHDNICGEVVMKLRGFRKPTLAIQRIKNGWVRDEDFGMVDVVAEQLMEWKK